MGLILPVCFIAAALIGHALAGALGAGLGLLVVAAVVVALELTNPLRHLR